MLTIFRRVMYVLRRSRHDADLREEIETHRTLRQAALEREGLGAEDAARESRRAMGHVTLAVEDARDVWVVRTLDALWQDIRIAARGLRKSPGFTLVTIATLALGIGANTALFSIFNGLLLRPLPVRDPGRLALLTSGSWSYPVWEQIRALETSQFDGAFAWATGNFDLAQGGRTVLVEGAMVSGRFFEVLGVSAVRGRMLTSADDSGAAPDGPVAVISHRFWWQHFGGAPDVIGRSLTVQRVPFTVVGVMPAGFFGVDVGRMVDVMLPFSADPLLRGRENRLASGSSSWLDIMVRLRPGQNIEQANAALQAAQPRIREVTSDSSLHGGAPPNARYLADPLTLEPAATGRSRLRRQAETPLTVMVVAVGLVLLVACANIASLVVARSLARRRELSVRLALGASRGRLAQLFFVETLMVAAAGAAFGLLFAQWSGALLVQQLSTWQSTVTLDLTLDRRVLAFTAILACLSAIVAGMAPVLGLKSVAAGEALKDAGRSVTGDRRFAVRGTLVVAQIAVSLVLIVAAGLFLRTFTSLSTLPLGFVPEPLIVVDLNLQAGGAPVETRLARVERLRDAAAATPGVRSASVSVARLLSGGGWATNSVAVDDGTMTEDRSKNRLWRNGTTPGWFATMGMPVLAGRDFNSGDRVGSPRVAIVNQAFVRRYRIDRHPVGRTIRLGGPNNTETRYEIVGLVADAAYTSPREGMLATMYVPLAQRERDFWPTVLLTINAAPGQRAAVERDVAVALARTDPTVAFTFRTFDQYVDATVARERLIAMLSGFFGGLALLLAAIGLYGVVSQGVRARRAEIGLRMALGAAASGIVRLVFRRVGVLIAAGLALGLASSAWAARFVTPLLFQVEAHDPSTFVTAAAVLVAVSLLAAWIPARRVARLDPAAVLREE